MSLKTLIIFQNKSLYNILNELRENLNLNILNIENENTNFAEYDEYLIISSSNQLKDKNQIILTEFPIGVRKLLKIINTNFLKKKFNYQSNIAVGNYELDLNSRILSNDKNRLDLTEMETKIILFLQKKRDPTNIKELQKRVWGQMPDLETHTVETHIYRLRKKIKSKFQDNNFINSTKDGYKIS